MPKRRHRNEILRPGGGVALDVWIFERGASPVARRMACT